VVPAGGSGSRIGGRTPKQYRALAEAPILVHPIACLARHPRIELVVVAAPADRVALTERVLRRHLGPSALMPRVLVSGERQGRRVVGAGRSPHRADVRPGGRSARCRVVVVAGGAERQESVARALDAVPAAIDLVLVHDAVRPFINRALVDRVLAAAGDCGAAICALPITETVKRVTDGVVQQTVDRTGLWAVQTPQAFRAELLREAHDKARRAGLLGTDDAMLVERLGHPVRVVRGLSENIKITTPADLRRARASACR
jgi:2-C-methyl-D-erythritol 4-phosphate cytidylyltransferase